MNIPYFNYQDKRLYYQIRESKANRAIIFIHGSGSSSNIWKNQLELDVDYNLIALDLPSHLNSADFPTVSLDLYLDVVRTLIDLLRYQEIILCGHSLGGAIIQSYYYKYPHDVKALILVGTGGRLRVSPIILENIKSDYNKYLDSVPIGAFFKKTSKDIINEFIRDANKMKPEIVYEDFKICDGFDMLSKTITIKVPCLVICGAADMLTPLKYSKFFHEKLKDSQLVIIKKAGHMVMLEKPKEVNEAIKKHILSL